ncbi:MAG: ABC transporter permease [Sporichthyaceae bacterium]|nr:ABC transporter permease [Sporichthyaceae bacterium]
MAVHLEGVAPGVGSTPGDTPPSEPLAGGPGGSARHSSGIARVVIRRIIGAIFSLAAVLVFNFFLFRVLPGDPARKLARSRHLSQEATADLRERLGLTKPIWEQFTSYLNDLAHFDLGTSFLFHRPVADIIGERIWPTLLLVGSSTLLSIAFGLWIGIKGAWQRGSAFDRVSNATSLTLYSMPIFWLGIVLLLYLAGVQVGLGWFPTGGIHDPNVTGGWLASTLDVVHHLFLPCLTLTLAYLAEFSLVMRSSLLDEMGQDYLTTARAKGLRDVLVRRRHAVPNALLPAVTLIFLHFGFIISGALTVELVYSWPGLGKLSIEALDFPDFPLLQAIFLLFAVSTIVFNLIGDLLLGVLDPRVRDA